MAGMNKNERAADDVKQKPGFSPHTDGRTS